MSVEVKKEIALEIAHVLFMDVVGYSKLSVDEQHQIQEQLNQVVRGSEQVRAAPADKLTILPTGDGMALVFFTSPETPVECAIEISTELKSYPHLQLRIGIHSGPVSRTTDLNQRTNVAGAGINFAQRVMDCGDAGHILLSKRAADDLAPLQRWQHALHDIGEAEVKHGVRISVVSLFTGSVGNPALPSKLRREAQKRAAAVSRKRRKLITLLGSGLAVLAFVTVFLLQRTLTKKLEKSIAVLPFENLSAEKANAYFAGGVQDQILTNLAKIGDLKVISRTSVMAYARNQRTIREIAKTLGVATVVEGSVQRIGNRIRISVQLINAANDDHLWAENYEKDVSDIATAQKDVAFEIAASLHAQLSPNEKAQLQRRPTSNGAAYLLYLQAQDAFWWAQSMDEVEKVIQLYQRAIELDPTFALAFAKLSYVESILYYNRPSVAVRDKAKAAVSEAIRLQPDLPEAHFALGYIYFWCEPNYERALAEFDIARAGLPNDADVFAAIAAIRRRQGKWAESTANYEKASVLNPKDTTIWSIGLGTNYRALRDYSTAAKMIDRAIAADPNFFPNRIWRAWLDIDSKGDVRAMEDLLAQTPETIDPDGVVTVSRFELKCFHRKYDEALGVLDRAQLETFDGIAPGAEYPKSFLRAQAYLLKNDMIKAHTFLDQSQRLIERRIQENPRIGAPHALLGQIHAGMGRKDDAIREGKRAVELSPESEDALYGPAMTLALARIYTMLGNADSALPLLEHSLSTPRGVTVPVLKLDPIWDPLRNDPRFDQMLANASVGPLPTK
jgi:TolB-like protein